MGQSVQNLRTFSILCATMEAGVTMVAGYFVMTMPTVLTDAPLHNKRKEKSGTTTREKLCGKQSKSIEEQAMTLITCTIYYLTNTT